MKKCDDCGKHFNDDSMKFCSECGGVLQDKIEEPKEKTCQYCSAVVAVGQKFCNQCGKLLFEEDAVIKNDCPICGFVTNEGERFCQQCGAKISNKKNGGKTVESAIANGEILDNITKVGNAIKNNEFISSVRQDLNQSRAINIIKGKSKNAAQRIEMSKFIKMNIVVVVVIIAIVALSVVFNIHKCENCDKTYVGKQYSLVGGEVCKNCYEYYTVLEW